MHTFLALDVALIPQQTKDNIPTFWNAVFSKDGVKNDDGSWLKEPSRMLLDGYNDNRELVHSNYVLMYWLQWEDDPSSKLSEILSTAIEYTKEQYKTEKLNPLSIWYEEDL